MKPERIADKQAPPTQHRAPQAAARVEAELVGADALRRPETVTAELTQLEPAVRRDARQQEQSQRHQPSARSPPGRPARVRPGSQRTVHGQIPPGWNQPIMRYMVTLLIWLSPSTAAADGQDDDGAG